MTGSSGKKKKVGDGSGLAYLNDVTYCLKGNNTNEFWSIKADSGGAWVAVRRHDCGQQDGQGRRLDLPPACSYLYALRGNNTFDFFMYNPGGVLLATAPKSDVYTATDYGTLQTGLRIAPNPFTNATTVSYSLAKAGNVSLKLYDVTGKLVTTVASGYFNAGSYTTHVDASKLASGIYLLKYETNGYTTTRKLIIE